MNERTILIGEYLSGGYSVSDLARRRGISRKTAFKWIERYEESGWAGLEDQSRAPHHQARAISPAMERLILELKERWPKWGAPKIHAKLQEHTDCPSESTVGNVLARYGLTRQARRRAGRATPSQKPLSHCQGPNQVWCVDFKGWFRTGDGLRCDPLTVTDAHTRYLLCCQGIGTSTGLVTVKPLLELTFRQFGLPEAIRTDNGPPFASTGLAGLTELSVWWLTLGIRVERITPGHPEQNGRHERMHRTLKEATQPPERNLRAQQRVFEAFQHEYNEHRPHEALGQKPPATYYVPSPRDYPERIVPWDYADDWQKRQISPGGQMRWKGQKVNLSRALIGHTVGLEPIEEGLWSIHFRNLELGWWDERKWRLLPADALRYA